MTAAGQAGSSLENSTIEYAGSGYGTSFNCTASAPIAVIAWGGTAIGPTITGNTVSHYPATDYGLDVDVAITNGASYSQNTFSGGIAAASATSEARGGVRCREGAQSFGPAPRLR